MPRDFYEKYDHRKFVQINEIILYFLSEKGAIGQNSALF